MSTHPKAIPALRLEGLSDSALRCPICDKQEWQFAQRVRFSPLLRCARCGLLGTRDFVSGTRIPDHLYEVGPESHVVYRKHYLPKRMAVYERVLPQLERFRRTSRLLEVGSSYGYFLERASGSNWQAEGVELAAYPCQVACSKGAEVVRGKLQDVPLERGSYDVIVMWDVIEHLTDIGEVLDSVFALLRSGGALVARTPDARALQGSMGMFGAAYRHLAYPANAAEHVYHFTPEGLALLMEKKGFRHTEVDTHSEWGERIIGGRNVIIRLVRLLIFGYAYFRRWPYEFIITASKP